MKTKFNTPPASKKGKSRIQVSIDSDTIARAERLIKADCRTGLSNLFEALTAQEYERRFPGQPSPLLLKRSAA